MNKHQKIGGGKKLLDLHKTAIKILDTTPNLTFSEFNNWLKKLADVSSKIKDFSSKAGV